MLDNEYQTMAANAIAHAAQMAGEEWRFSGAQMSRPSVLFKPNLSVDGNKWCALYGNNLQDGVAGFGNSPASAMEDFDKQWYVALS